MTVWLRRGLVELHCRPEAGFVIEAIHYDGGKNLLWTKDPLRPFAGKAGQRGAPSSDSFHDQLIGGWFLMAPTAGHPGLVDGEWTWLHGFAARLAWEITAQSETAIEAEVESDGFRLRRSVIVEDRSVHVSTTVMNVSATRRSWSGGEHPCLSREFFAGGEIRLRAQSATSHERPMDPSASVVQGGTSFTWPLAPTAGPQLDLSKIPTVRDGRHDHLYLTIDSGTVTVTAPRESLAIRLVYEAAALPYALVWERFADETWDVFAIEPSTSFGRSVDEAVNGGTMRLLAPGETASFAMAMEIQA